MKPESNEKIKKLTNDLFKFIKAKFDYKINHWLNAVEVEFSDGYSVSIFPCIKGTFKFAIQGQGTGGKGWINSPVKKPLKNLQDVEKFITAMSMWL